MISTGLAKLDKLLGGGISGGAIYDIFGPSGTGKTQLAMQICANAIREKIIYQDTTGTFRPERILQMIRTRGLGPELLDNITVARITNAAEQVASLGKIPEVRPALVVIDNISDLFSFEYAKESNSLEKHIMFMHYMRALSLACIQNSVPAVVTNSVRGTGEEERENLDKSISIFTHKKIRLSKTGTKFGAEVLPSFGPKKEMSFEITPEGLAEPS
ncbi:MAG TPA: ATPase domain-containing protein [Candidatus Nitrosotalea sp.]|nr:ATPase domain-containing protein [Candidatus Nitrosotalea sp.]